MLASGMVIGNSLNSNLNSNYFFTLFRIPIRIAIVFPLDFEFKFQLIGLIVNYFNSTSNSDYCFFASGCVGTYDIISLLEDMSISKC